MKLIGRTTSINVQKVRWLLAELDVAYDLQELGGAFGGLDTPEFTALNPNRLVPVLMDRELVLWESNAILRYLARNHAEGTFEGTSPAEIAKADMWMEWFQNRALQPLTAVFYQTVRLPMADRCADTCAAAVQRLNDAYQLLDHHLDQRDWLVSDRLSLGDIVVGTSLYRYFSMDFERPTLPALSAYYAHLQQRPSYCETVMVSYDSLRPKED